MPLITSTFEPIQGATTLTKRDLHNTYHLVRICEGDECKTAFNTPFCHFEYLIMPFGLTNAPAVFQALINDLLRDYLNLFMFECPNDILITGGMSVVYSKDYWRTVSTSKLKNVNTTHFLSPFSATSSKEGRLRWTKLRWWQSGPLPSTVSNSQDFLVFANFYRRFIRSYSFIASPLTKLTSVINTFLWTPEDNLTFQQLKDKFTSAPILIQPNPD